MTAHYITTIKQVIYIFVPQKSQKYSNASNNLMVGITTENKV